MPALVAGTHEESRPADRPADESVVDTLPRRLMRAAEKGVGRRSEPQVLRAGRVDELPRLGESDAKRLLGMDVLAGGDGLEAHFNMRFGHREVQDDLNRGIGQNRLDRLRWNAEFSGTRLGGGEVHVGKRDNIEDRKRLGGLQIGSADIAATDHRDFDPVHASSLSQSTREAARGRSCPTARHRVHAKS